MGFNLLGEEVDDFHTSLNEAGLEIAAKKTMIDLLDKICIGQKDTDHYIPNSSKE
jgi:hypothetical protein